jgi:hypothetical protein
MKSIAFRAIKNSNGYVRSAFVGNAGTDSKSPGAWGFVVAVSLLLLTASVVGLLLLNK